MTGQARRSAGANSAPDAAASSAKRALAAAEIPVGARRRPWAAGAAAVATTLCAGLVLTASSPVGQSAVAVPAPVTAIVNRDVDTLSRGNINREASIQVADGEDTPTVVVATPAATIYYVVSSAYLRAQPTTLSNALTTLSAGSQVTANGDSANGWQPVTAGSTSGFVKTSLLSTTPPTKKLASSLAAAVSSYPACASGSAVEAGLVTNAILVHRAVCGTFPEVTAYNGLRGDGSEHASGKAIDCMTSGARGQAIAAWLQANYSKLGIVEIIYQQQIWTTQRASEGWRAMPDRGSATANHFDHIHVLVG